MKVNMAKVRATVVYWQSLTEAEKAIVVKQAHENNRGGRSHKGKEAEDERENV